MNGAALAGERKRSELQLLVHDDGGKTATTPESVGEQFELTTSAARVRWIFVVLMAAASTAFLLLSWMTPDPIPRPASTLLPLPVFVNGDLALITPGYVLVSELTAYNDELFAFLMFDYLRHREPFRKTRLLLAFDQQRTTTPYSLVMRGQTDLTGALADIYTVDIPGARPARTWGLIPASKAGGIEQQTRLFVTAYNLPARRKFEELPRKAVASYLRRFIQFKSATDPRIRLKLEPVPAPLTVSDAQHMAGDIITIADFYSLPLEMMLGIGAMENNYMNVRGDLTHSIWKRRPAQDDVILERRRGRVRVLNDSSGVWQITRETLRYAHTLVRRDTRDYTQLPEHLRPPEKLLIDEVSPTVLTTYAGILLRDLLDRFDGDVMLAVSAYNGGPARPNLRYGEGAQRAASHARRVLEQAAALNGESVVRMTWLRRP